MDEIDFLDHSEIDYSSLQLSQLMRLVYDVDYYKATDALYEINKRNSEQSRSVSKDILLNKKGDIYLQAQALSILLKKDTEWTIEHLNQNIKDFNISFLWQVVDFFYETPSQININLDFSQSLNRLAQSQSPDPNSDEYFKKGWLNRYLQQNI